MTRNDVGSQADSPTQIPARGWRQVLGRAIRQSQQDNIPLLAAGGAFFGFLALFPALIALVTLVGMVADPGQITQQVQSFTAGLPQASRQLISDQLTAITYRSGGALTVGLVTSLVVALWSASSGTSNLMTVVNIAYEEKETRGFLKLRAVALLLTLGTVVFLVLTLALIAVVPVVLHAVPLGPLGTVLAQVLRWVLLVALIFVGLAVLYWVAPDRNPAKFRWVSMGSMLAALLWLLGTVGFSLYVNFFGNYNKTYGALAGVIVLLLWLWLTYYIVLLGAEINAEAELQTACDTTAGEPKPIGQRGAVVADTMPGYPEGSSGHGRAEAAGLAGKIAELLDSAKLNVAVAESLTGGMVASTLAEAPGSSRWFRGAVVAYASEVKHELLTVPLGPVVSAQAAAAMAEGVRRLLKADIAVALTGAGGPDGQDGQPPGTVFLGLSDGVETQVAYHHFDSDNPTEVCAHAVAEALRLLHKHLRASTAAHLA